MTRVRRTVRNALLALLAALAGFLGLVPAGRDFVRGYAEGRSSDQTAILAEYGESTPSLGAIRFAYGDFGGINTDALRTNAIPWKVVAAALVLQARRDGEADRAALNRVLSGFGFIFPDTILNWTGPARPRPFSRPLGIVTGYVERSVPRIKLEVGNLGCAACHAGMTYDRSGAPRRQVWLGLPNTSLDLEAYTTGVYESLARGVRAPGPLLETVRALFPEVDSRELRTIGRVVLPRIERRLTELEATQHAPLPFRNGGPGLTNGVAALKFQLGLLRGDVRFQEVGFTSIPDLGGRGLRTSLLYDGAYAVPSKNRFSPMALGDLTEPHLAEFARIVTFFTVPTMGIKPKAARRAIPHVTDVMHFLQSYAAPPFPGHIDSVRARRGGVLYRARCAECHGSYSEGAPSVGLVSFPNRLVPQAAMGTDPARWQAMEPRLLRAIRSSGYSAVDPAQTGGYVAPPLTALWATAPYLHNGSVPTLWHLMHPADRPPRFQVGGHRLDFERVGIAGAVDGDGTVRYSASYRPWANPRLFDTAQPGLGNRGHESPFQDLTEQQKGDLLEYLKLL